MKCIGRQTASLKDIGRTFSIEALCGEGVAEGVRQALEEGPSCRRRGLLQPPLMFWFLIASSLYRAESLIQVLSRLLMPLRNRGILLKLQPVTDGAISHARKWFGSAPLRRFFRWLASRVQPDPSFYGLRVWALDGTMITVPDSKANQRLFQVCKTAHGRCSHPMFKVVALIDAATRRIRGVQRGQWRSPERPLAFRLLRHIGPGDLVLLDRGFYGVWFLRAIRRQGAHFLVRVPNTLHVRLSRADRRRGEGWVEVHSQRAYRHGELGHLRLRLVHYHIAGFSPCRLATSLDDAVPAIDLVRQYHVRWEVELALDELKTHLSAPARGATPTVLRSQMPANIQQEFFATLAAYNLIRELIRQGAAQAGQPPHRMSFVGTLNALSLTLPEMQSALSGDLPALYARFVEDLATLVLPRSRRPRSMPRVLKKVRSSHLPVKTRRHKERKLDLNQITIGCAA